MGLLLFLVFGLFVGFLARLFMPGRQRMGLFMTLSLGVVGSFLGGFLADILSEIEPMRVHPAGLVGSVVGALIVLGLSRIFRDRRALPGQSLPGWF